MPKRKSVHTEYVKPIVLPENLINFTKESTSRNKKVNTKEVRTSLNERAGLYFKDDLRSDLFNRIPRKTI